MVFILCVNRVSYKKNMLDSKYAVGDVSRNFKSPTLKTVVFKSEGLLIYQDRYGSMSNRKQDDKGKKFSSEHYMGISVGMGIIIGVVVGIIIPAIGIGLGVGIGIVIGAVIGTHLQKKHKKGN